jgi:hypothetical protein
MYDFLARETMVEYQDTGIFPQPLDRLWTLLRAHREDGTIASIHPLIRSQKTVSRTDTESVVDRVIHVRGKGMGSRWRLTYRPPEFARWEILESEGPWTSGSYIESAYTPDPEGTRIRSRGELKIKVLPFFLPQGRIIRKVLGTIEDEDLTFLR